MWRYLPMSVPHFGEIQHHLNTNGITLFRSITMFRRTGSVMWNIPHTQTGCEEYRQSHITLLWIWIMLWAIWVIGNHKFQFQSIGKNYPHGFEVPHNRATAYYLVNDNDRMIETPVPFKGPTWIKCPFVMPMTHCPQDNTTLPFQGWTLKWSTKLVPS